MEARTSQNGRAATVKTQHSVVTVLSRRCQTHSATYSDAAPAWRAIRLAAFPRLSGCGGFSPLMVAAEVAVRGPRQANGTPAMISIAGKNLPNVSSHYWMPVEIWWMEFLQRRAKHGDDRFPAYLQDGCSRLIAL
jgi:hypothetical protein